MNAMRNNREKSCCWAQLRFSSAQTSTRSGALSPQQAHFGCFGVTSFAKHSALTCCLARWGCSKFLL
eukprot:5171876-Amphidinium_carterae.1